MFKDDKLTTYPTFWVSLCSTSKASTDNPAEISYADFQQASHSDKLTGFMENVHKTFDVMLLTDGRTLRCVLRATYSRSSQAPNNQELPYVEDLHMIARRYIDLLLATAAELEKNRLSAVPVCIKLLPSASSHVVHVLDSLSRAGAHGITVEYRYEGSAIELPILPREAFADLTQSEPLTRTINTIINGVDRDWATLEVGLILADGSRLQAPQDLDIDTACQCIISKTLLVGRANRADGRWHLEQGWQLVSQTELKSN